MIQLGLTKMNRKMLVYYYYDRSFLLLCSVFALDSGLLLASAFPVWSQGVLIPLEPVLDQACRKFKAQVTCSWDFSYLTPNHYLFLVLIFLCIPYIQF